MATVLRGATTINFNNKSEMQNAVLEMYDNIIAKNNLSTKDIVFIIFACTKDLTCGNPATFLRINRTEVSEIPLLSLAHHEYTGALKKCIRVMLMTSQQIDKPIHVYLNKAKKLREDLNDKYSN